MITSNRRRGYAIDLDGSSEYASVTPSLRLTGEYSLQEDFSDGNYTGWTVSSGAYSVDNSVANPLSTNQYSLVCNTAGVISIPCNQRYGKWKFQIYKGNTANTYDMNFISSSATTVYPSFQGYFFELNANERINFYKVSGSSGTALYYSADAYLANNTFYEIEIQCNTNGQFYTYITGGAYTTKTLVSVTGGGGANPVTDNTYTSSNYFVLDLDANDRIANIQCEYGEGSLDLNSFERIRKSFTRDMELTSITSDDVTLGSELVANGDFESFTGGVGTGWTLNGGTGSQETTIVYAGSSSQKIALSSQVLVYIRQSISTTAGTTYRINGYARADQAITLRLADYNGGASDYQSKTLTPNTWTYFELYVAKTNTAIQPIFTTAGAAPTVNVYIDNISVKEVTAIPYIGNGNHSVAISSTDKKSGSNSMAITSSAAGDATTNYVSLASDKRVDVVAGKKYTYEAWARGTGVVSATDLLSGWNFTSGWNAGTNATIIDNNSFSSSSGSSSWIVKSSVVSVGKTYKLVIAGTTTASQLSVQDGGISVYYGTIAGGGSFNSTIYFIATATSVAIRNLSAGTTDITTLTLQEVTPPTLTLALGNQTKSVSSISCVPGTFTKLVWNFQATSAEVGQPLKMYVNQADVVYVDDVSLTQAYDALANMWVKSATTPIATKTIVGLYNTAGTVYFTCRSGINNYLETAIGDGSVNVATTSTSLPISNDIYSMASFKIDRLSNIEISNNGVLTTNGATNISNYGKLLFNTIYIGKNSATTYFYGNIGEVQIVKFDAIENSNVSASTLLSAYYNGIPSNWAGGNPQVVANYKFRGNTNTLLLDDNSISNNDLTGTNVTTADQTNGTYPRR